MLSLTCAWVSNVNLRSAKCFFLSAQQVLGRWILYGALDITSAHRHKDSPMGLEDKEGPLVLKSEQT
jgi:hypothetical protein